MIIFDTETTGLVKSIDLPSRVQPRLIEIYAVRVSEGFIIEEELHILLNPNEKITNEIIHITGITNEMLAHEPTYSESKEKIIKFFSLDDIWCGHNVMFDYDMLRIEARRYKVNFPKPKKLICTVEETEHLIGRRLNLTDLHMLLFNSKFDSAHRAKADVEATLKCFKELVARKDVDSPW